MRPLILASALALAACSTTPPQNSAALLGTYNAAVSAEIGYLTLGKPTPAEATKLRAIHRKASAAVDDLVAAEKIGGNTAALYTAAMLASAELAAASKGK